MKNTCILLSVIVLVSLLSGCAQSPRFKKVYTLKRKFYRGTVQVIDENRALIFDGSQGEVYDFVHNHSVKVPSFNFAFAAWEGIAPIPYSHSQQLLFLGGHPGKAKPSLTSNILYHVEENRIEPLKPWAPSRYGHTADLLESQKILIMGGVVGVGNGVMRDGDVLADRMPEEVIVLDPITNERQIVGKLISSRHKHSTVKLDESHYLLIGGSGRPFGESGRTHPVLDIEMFDLSTGESRVLGQLTHGRNWPDVVKLTDNRLLVIGGNNSELNEKSPQGEECTESGCLSPYEVFDLNSNTVVHVKKARMIGAHVLANEKRLLIKMNGIFHYLNLDTLQVEESWEWGGQTRMKNGNLRYSVCAKCVHRLFRPFGGDVYALVKKPGGGEMLGVYKLVE